MSSYSFPGIAAATGTRVDSAAKHTMACRVNEALMNCWCENQQAPRSHLHTHKMKYCMHKNDLVLNCGQSLNHAGAIIKSSKAYPSVVSNLGDMTPCGKQALLWLYHVGNTAKNFIDKKEMLRVWCQNPDKFLPLLCKNALAEKERTVRELKDMPHFTAQGFSLGLAYASSLTGDTVGTVFIGGMVTVMNGAFEINSGEQVQWYFDFETDMFYTETVENPRNMRAIPSGTRKNASLDANISDSLSSVESKNKIQPSVSQEHRRIYNENQLGSLDAFPGGGSADRKKNIAYPKPYKISEDGNEHFADKIRIFAKCINGARPYEHVDLMLMTQSL